MSTGCIEKPREAKHFSILDSIHRLGVAVAGMEDLLADITGGPHCQPELGTREESISLAEVLNSAGSQIAGKAERIIELTHQIKSEIL